ncbi:MAG: A/G-specific adenine glycosylase [Bacteroidota bacterium]|nr:A/G-specific adenine glycosylase [Bacteroidota bacterium]
MDFGAIIMSWYTKNKRDLPWRKTRDPYQIWLSEIILQQTRVQQGLPYFFSFIKKYPDVKSLAEAAEDDILKLWQGLGYYSRARNLHFAAKTVLADFNGKFPGSYMELKRLKGVGDYTAAAISSICYNEVQAVVDGNVYRVLARIYGIDLPIDSTEGKKTFAALANELISRKHPADFNQSIMEFGAIQCVPKNPDCGVCPFALYCVARKKELIHILPVKSKKTKVTDRYFNYLVLHHKGNIYLKQRTEKDIWQGLFDFPLIETANPVNEKKLIQQKEWKGLFENLKFKIQNYPAEIRHILSHQRLHVRFVEVELKDKIKGEKGWLYVKEGELKKYAVPVVIANYLGYEKRNQFEKVRKAK